MYTVTSGDGKREWLGAQINVAGHSIYLMSEQWSTEGPVPAAALAEREVAS